jgi:hypothetical protein
LATDHGNTKPSGFTFVQHCKDLFTILGLDWHSRNSDTQGEPTPNLPTQMDMFLARSKRTDKAQWLREVFLGARTKPKPTGPNQP